MSRADFEFSLVARFRFVIDLGCRAAMLVAYTYNLVRLRGTVCAHALPTNGLVRPELCRWYTIWYTVVLVYHGLPMVLQGPLGIPRTRGKSKGKTYKQRT